MRASDCRWWIAENVKVLEIMLKYFCNLLQVENTESQLFYASKFLSISEEFFLAETIKQR